MATLWVLNGVLAGFIVGVSCGAAAVRVEDGEERLPAGWYILPIGLFTLVLVATFVAGLG